MNVNYKRHIASEEDHELDRVHNINNSCATVLSGSFSGTAFRSQKRVSLLRTGRKRGMDNGIDHLIDSSIQPLTPVPFAAAVS